MLLTAWPWKASATPPYNTQYGVIHYANYKVNGQNYGMAWKPVIAVMPLATTQNAISEAMNVLYERENTCKVQRCRHCQRFKYSLTFQVHTIIREIFVLRNVCKMFVLKIFFTLQ